MAFKFCPECGTQIDGAKFCPNCGAQLAANTPPSPQPSAPAPTPKPTYQSMADNSTNNTNNDILKRFGFKSAGSTPPPEPETVKETPSAPVVNAPTQSTKSAPELPPEPDFPDDTSYPSAPEPESAPPQPVSVEQNSVEDGKRKLQEIREAPDETNSPPPIRRKRPEKKKAEPKKRSSPFSSVGFQDEQQDEPLVKFVSDGLYNQAEEIDYSFGDDEENQSEDAPKKISRAANTAGSSIAKYSSAIVSKATTVAAKHLIDEDKKLDNVHKTYILEEALLADPNDPSYDGYYENIIPIDEREKEKLKLGGDKKFQINEESKKTLLIVVGLLIAMIILIFREFA